MAPRTKARIHQGVNAPEVAVDFIPNNAGEHPRGEDIPPSTTPLDSTNPAPTAPIPTPIEGATLPPPTPASGPGQHSRGGGSSGPSQSFAQSSIEVAKVPKHLRVLRSSIEYMAPIKRARTSQGANIALGVAVDPLFDEAGEHPRGKDNAPTATLLDSTSPPQATPVPTPTKGAMVPPPGIPIPPPASTSGSRISDRDHRGAIVSDSGFSGLKVECSSYIF
nr:nascent polypeptide-associated complex subunit alpha, muscle-specific form-like [Nicotiana tomentosiformis]